MNNASADKPLDLKCPCGYQQKIPGKFAGKKLVCPECQRTLRIERVLPTADLLSRCPFCQTIQNYDPHKNSCIHCQNEFTYPAFAPGKVILAEQVDESSEFDIGGPSTGIPSVTGTGNARVRRRKKSGTKAIIYILSYLSSIALAGYVAYWILNKQENGGGRPESPTQEVITKGDRKPNPLASEIATRKPRPNAKLKSPSIRIVEIEQEYAQALTQISGEVAGAKLFFEIEVENLTHCEITEIDFVIELTDAKGKRGAPVNYTIKFDKTFLAKGKQTVPITLPPEEFKSAKVIVTRVAAGEQVNETRIEKIVVAE